MVTNTRKKTTRYRGSGRHGHGRIHRKSGARGGKGHAGVGKRGKSHKPSVSQSGRRLGREGFTSATRRAITTINIKEIETKLDTWTEQNKVKKEGEVYHVDLKALGYSKLLSTGTPQHKLNISVSAASKSAAEKVSKAGGQVEVKA